MLVDDRTDEARVNELECMMGRLTMRKILKKAVQKLETES